MRAVMSMRSRLTFPLSGRVMSFQPLLVFRGAHVAHLLSSCWSVSVSCSLVVSDQAQRGPASRGLGAVRVNRAVLAT